MPAKKHKIDADTLTGAALDAEPRFNRWMELHTPNGAVPHSDVCGGAAAFLVSDLADHIHGQTLLVDGGMSARVG